nr:serine/threonine-protein kinase [Saccharomonospora amisosensis]
MIAGHYRLVEHVGSGAMGIVWRAIDERLERSVAVKQIVTQPGLSDDERATMRQRAMREARNAARFQHPNAIVVFDIAEHAGEPCLVMEYLPSRSLSAILAERGTLPVPEVARIGEQVAAALVAAHRAGIVHRDIKPGNILIDDNGTCKITDFGISRASGDLTLTQTGLIGGTPAYLAPELARGADPTPSSDVFALGATLYHAIEGLPPYGDSTNQLALLYAAANGKVNPPTRAGAATALLMSLLRTEPQERPSMNEARDRLATLATSEANGNSSPATRVSPPLPVAGAGAKPATAEPPRAPAPPPPWQRNAAEAPRHNPTSTYPPVPPRNGANNGAGAGNGRRKPLVFGAIGLAAALVVTVLIVALNTGGTDDPNTANQGGSTASSAPPSSGPPSTSESNQVQNSDSAVDWGVAGQRVIDFYDDPEKNWDMLTPASQALFGDKKAYKDYWDDHEIRNLQSAVAYKRANNPDGSVDISVNVDFGSGLRPMYLTVLDSGGKLLLDGDPRPEHNVQR